MEFKVTLHEQVRYRGNCKEHLTEMQTVAAAAWKEREAKPRMIASKLQEAIEEKDSLRSEDTYDG